MLYAFLMALISVWGWGQTWQKLSNHSDVTSSGIYLIVDTNSSRALSGSNGTASAPDAIAVTMSSDGNTITGGVADALQWTFEQSGSSYVIHPKGSTTTWLYSTSSNNGIRVGTNNNKTWNLDVTGGGSVNYKGFSHVGTSRYLGVYSNSDWRGYTSSGTNIGSTNIEIFGLVTNTPSFTSTDSFNTFTYIESNGPSVSQLVSVSGANLDNNIPVTVSAPANYEISLTNNNDFSDSKTITYSGGEFVSQSLYVRLKSGLSVGNYSGDVIVSGGGVSTAKVFAVDGNVVTVPTVSASSFTGTVGASFNDNIQATQNPTSYALVSGNLPLGLNLNTSTGVISGTPNSAGTFTANVTATNDAGTSAPATVTFTIAKGDQTITGFADQTKFFSDPAFTLPVNTNADLAITYSSSDTSVATVSGNTVTVAGLGTTTITAAQQGNNDWNTLTQTIALTIVADPVVYNGVGRFEKINSLADLTDGYYILADADDDVMAGSTISSGTLVTSSLNPVNNIVVNPLTDDVFNIINGNGTYTLQNVGNSKFLNYVSSTNLSYVDNATGDKQKWNITYNASGYYRFASADSSTRILKYNSSLTTPGFKAYTISTQSPEVALYKLIETTVWDGSVWSNGAPQGKDVEITGIYTTSSNPAFTAKNITIKNGGSLEITNANTIAAENITVEDGGNLIQRDGSMLNYSGTFNVLKNTSTDVDKYAFWSSPVAGQNLASIYDGASAPFLITEYSTATNQYVNSTDAAAVAGKGYSIKRPAGNGTLTFTGTPHNELINTYILNSAASGFNLVGNPYPSDLSLPAFYAANSSNISSTFYFWDSSSPAVTSPTGASTTNYGYATYNAAGSPTWVAAPNLGAVSPTGNVAKIGQAFIVKATASNALVLNNSMRGAEAGSFFNKNNSSTEGKFWLQLSTSYNANNTFAVTYSNGASNALDAYDSKAMGTGSNAFYTIAANNRLVIQGRSSFNANDVVPVGTKHFEAGDFVISLVQKEGLFNNGQPIYLHDKQLNTYTDLQNATYAFSAGAGEFTNRFELVYTMGVLSTAEADKNTFEVYRDGNQFVVRNAKKIENVEVYDAAGRKIVQLSPNATTTVLNLEAKGVYILKAVSNGKTYSQKIIK